MVVDTAISEAGLDVGQTGLDTERTDDGQLVRQAIPDPNSPQEPDIPDKTIARGSCSYAASLGRPYEFG